MHILIMCEWCIKHKLILMFLGSKTNFYFPVFSQKVLSCRYCAFAYDGSTVFITIMITVFSISQQFLRSLSRAYRIFEAMWFFNACQSRRRSAMGSLCSTATHSCFRGTRRSWIRWPRWWWTAFFSSSVQRAEATKSQMIYEVICVHIKILWITVFSWRCSK